MQPLTRGTDPSIVSHPKDRGMYARRQLGMGRAEMARPSRNLMPWNPAKRRALVQGFGTLMVLIIRLPLTRYSNENG